MTPEAQQNLFKGYTIPETNSLPLKMDGLNTNVLFGSWPIFRERLLLVSGRAMKITSNNNNNNRNICIHIPISCQYPYQFDDQEKLYESIYRESMSFSIRYCPNIGLLQPSSEIVSLPTGQNMLRER